MNQWASQSVSDSLSTWTSGAALEGVSVEVLLTGFCERAVAAGIPLVRVQIGTGVVHHGIRGYGMTWRRGTGIQDEEAFAHQETPDPRWYRSPPVYMLEHGLQFLTARLDEDEKPEPWFLLYDDLIAQGVTEYHTEGFSFGWESTADHDTNIPDLGVITSWSTDRPGGFGHALAELRQALPVFGLAMKTAVFTEMAEDLMTTYVGKETGRRILHGDVHRGDVRRLQAAIMLSDLRGFTALSDQIPSEDMVALLNTYLDTICAAVHANGGEVLKFLGDGLLAVFTQPDEAKAAAALAAGQTAQKAVQKLNNQREREEQPLMPLDTALHLGEVSYGNIGAEDRLDFTVIGPAVNEAARMEAACGDLGYSLLVSEALAGALDGNISGLTDLGMHELRGVSQPRRLYGVTVE